LLSPQSPLAIQQAAVQALADSDQGTALLQELPQASPLLQEQIQALLLKRPEWTRLLIEETQRGTIRADDLSAATRQALLTHQNPEIREAARQLLAAQQSTSRDEIVTQYLPALRMKGDPLHGRELFERRCASCHQHEGLGQDLGPKLSGLVGKTADFYLTAILDPNRAAEAKYRGYAISTVDGLVYTGLMVNETATSIDLARTDGKKETILRSDIEEMVSTRRSFMPEGFEKDLSPQDLADVISFVIPAH
jgi:putative heme-binding domain-containing protein